MVYIQCLLPIDENSSAAFRPPVSLPMCSPQPIFNASVMARSFADKPDDDGSCVKQRLDDRYDRVAAHKPRASGMQFWTFSCSDSFEHAGDAGDNSDGADQDRPGELDLRFPQIDQPINKNERVFNKKIRDMVSGYTDPSADWRYSDMSVDISVIHNDDRVINVKIDSYFYGHGTPHGTGATQYLTFLVPEARVLKPEDIFRPNLNWREILASLCKKALEVLPRDGLSNNAPTIADLDVINKYLADDSIVSLLPSGIVVYFEPGEIAGGYAAGDRTVTIDWNDLTPYLNPKYQFLRAPQ
jgi:hypothetical protein